jgi:hypothetical protein
MGVDAHSTDSHTNDWVLESQERFHDVGGSCKPLTGVEFGWMLESVEQDLKPTEETVLSTF